MARSRKRNSQPVREQVTKRKGGFSPAALPWIWFATGLYVLFMAFLSFAYWQVGGYGVETDALAGYLPDTQRLLHGAFTTLDGFKGPGYHIALAAVGFVVRDFFIAAKLVALISAGAVLLLTFRMTKRHLGQWTAWLIWLILATNAQFVLYTIQIGTDMYFLALAVAAAYLLLERPGTSRRAQIRWMLLAGFITGHAYLTRYNGLFLIVGGIVILLFADWKEIPEFSETSDEQRLPWQTRIYRTLAFLVGTVAPIIPWGLFTASKGRGFFYNVNYLNIAYEMYGSEKVSWDQFWQYFPKAFHSFGDVIAGDPAGFIWIIVRNGATHLWMDLNRVLIAGSATWVTGAAVAWGILMLAGLVAVILRFGWRAWPALFLGLMTYGVLIPVFYGERFSLPALPWYAVLVAVAVMWAATRDSWPEVLQYAPSAALVALLFTATYSTYGQASGLLASSPVEVKLIADVAKGKLDPDAAILARKPHIAWHLGLQNRRIPIINSVAELPDIAREQHAKYLFVSGIEASLRRPLIPLLQPKNAPPFLKPLAATQGRPAVLYEFLMPIDPPPPPETVEYVAPDRSHESPLGYRLGTAYAEAGRYDLAREEYESLLRSHPDEPTAQFGLAMISVRQAREVQRNPRASATEKAMSVEQMNSATRQIDDIGARNPGSFALQKLYGDFLVDVGRPGDALEAYRRALAVAPGNAEILKAIEQIAESH